MDFYQNDEPGLIRRITNWIVDITVAFSLAWFCLYAFGTQIDINGQSMVPLLDNGDVVLMNRLAYDLGSPNRMDVVVFEREDQRTNVKRVIGIPGDVIQIREGILYVNQEEFHGSESLKRVSLAGLAEHPIELGEDEYFLLGDNRDSSEDSRFANIGNVKKQQIQGKVWLRLFPLTDMKLIRSQS